MTTGLQRRWGLAMVAFAFALFTLCLLLSCATEVWLMGPAGRAANQVIFCVVPSSTKLSLEYINPYMSQRILRPSFFPPCVAVPWSPAWPQSGGWKFPP